MTLKRKRREKNIMVDKQGIEKKKYLQDAHQKTDYFHIK
jgi:hypothetical protein